MKETLQKEREWSHGFAGLLRIRFSQGDYIGIPNGIPSFMNPTDSPHVYYNYDVNNVLTVKPKNKRRFQKDYGLEVNPDKPLFGIVSRIDEGQKGFGLFLESINGTTVIEHILRKGGQFVIAGSGDKALEQRIEEEINRLSHKYPHQAIYLRGYSPAELTDKIDAASDATIVPSFYEPFGLRWGIAMLYGAVPIARKTGGMADYIKGGENGFLFERFVPLELADAITRFFDRYEDKKAMERMVHKMMVQDLSWKVSIKEYIHELYLPAIEKARGMSSSPVVEVDPEKWTG